jgi:hypothetical protein
MRPIAIPLLCLMLTACQIDPYTHHPDWTGTDWFTAGKEAAMSGAAVKTNETLADEYNDPDVDRNAWLKGYKEGQQKICKEDFLFARANRSSFLQTGMIITSLVVNQQ